MTNALTETQQDELREELNRGHKIAAIKLYLLWHDCSLKDAKTAVEQFALGDESCEPPASNAGPLTDSQMDKILDEIARGKKLAAFKLYRSYSGQSLRESKEFIEKLMGELKGSSGSAVDSERSGCFSVVLFAVGLTIVSLIIVLTQR
jgi:ribosomal protein L7/L12